MTIDKQMLTIEEVAWKFKVHPESVRRWLRTKRIHGTKLSSSWRISPAEVDRISREGVPPET